MTGSGVGWARLDGTAVPLDQAALSLDDDGATRGDGAFETIGVWSGRPFRVDEHLRRLRASLAAIGLPEPDVSALQADIAALVAGVERRDAMLRVYVTAGGRRVVVLAPQPERPPLRRLSPRPAPWIRPRGSWGPAGAKTMSYAPNMAAVRAAQGDGFDDALLVSQEGWVLEGSTFCVLWVAAGVVHAPDLDLGIVASISRRALLELAGDEGIPVTEGRWTLDELAGADEVLTCSAVRPLTAVRLVGGHTFAAQTPIGEELAAALTSARHGK